MAKAKKQVLSLDEQLEQALVPESEQPYSIPENWVWVTARCGYDITSSKRVHKEDWRNSGVPFFRTRELVILSEHQLVDNELFITEEQYKQFKEDYGVPKINDILISGVGTIGVPYIVKDNRPFYFKDGNIIWFKNKGLFESMYIFYLYKSSFMKNQIKSLSSGTTVDTYTIVNANKTKIPLPALAEQQRIVAQIESLFQKLDSARDLVQNALDSFETRKAAILHKAFSGELTASWRVENPTMEGSWEERSLQSVCATKITDGTHQTPTYCDKNVGVPFISAKDVTCGQIDWTKIKYITQDLHEKLYKRLAPQRDDILLAKNGTTGVAALVETDKVFDLYVTLAVLRPNKDCIVPKYLYHVVNSPICKNQFDEHLTGIGVPNLHLRDIKEVDIPLPSLPEQQEIVRILDSLLENEQKAKDLCDILDQIDLMKKSILARAFRGELGTNDPGEESALELLKEALTETVSGVKA